MLGELSNTEKRIYALSFHVDYWDRLGWRDPFGQKAFSKRQRRYAQVLKDRRVYTPEMVVNGRDGFVGSDRLRAKHRIEQALKDVPEISLRLNLTSGTQKGRLLVAYEIDVEQEGAVLNVALAEKKAEVNVPRGENAGRLLTHHNVVREFVTVKAEAGGTVRLKLPDGLQADDVEVIGFVQDKKTMSILAAQHASIEQ